MLFDIILICMYANIYIYTLYICTLYIYIIYIHIIYIYTLYIFIHYIKYYDIHTGLDINDRNFPPNVSLRAELYDGAKLFYLSGLQYGCDAKNAFSTLNESGTHNVGLVLVKKCQHMIWVAGSFTHQNRTKLLYKRMRTGDQSSTIWQALSQAGDPESGSLYCCPGLRDSSFLQGDF